MNKATAQPIKNKDGPTPGKILSIDVRIEDNYVNLLFKHFKTGFIYIKSVNTLNYDHASYIKKK